MKTKSSLRATLLASFILGGFTTTMLAGPGPQYWRRPVPPAATPEKTTPAALCAGCKTTALVSTATVPPSGKGVPSARVISTKHECSRCNGTIVARVRPPASTMTHNAACVAMGCCK